MKTQLNHPAVSKINWTSIVIQLATIVFLFGVIPKQFEAPVIALIGLVLPALIQLFRTKYTGPT